MNRSESIGALAAALAKAQAEIKDAFAGTENLFLKSRYADLREVLKSARPALSEQELSVTQLVGSSDQDVTVETVLMHSSGEWISETITMPVQVNKGLSQAQAMGAVITYARRYGLAAIVGISQEDTDATGSDAPSYSETQKAYFDKYIADGNALALHLFKNRVGDDVFIDLFNSFPAGEKTKQKAEVRRLENQGVNEFITLSEGVDNNDSGVVAEILEDQDSTVQHMLANSLGAKWKDCKSLLDSVKES